MSIGGTQAPSEVRAHQRFAVPTAVFEYTGHTGLTATGPQTRRRYVFDRPGARVVVDGRDVNALRAIAVLRQIRGG